MSLSCGMATAGFSDTKRVFRRQPVIGHKRRCTGAGRDLTGKVPIRVRGAEHVGCAVQVEDGDTGWGGVRPEPHTWNPADLTLLVAHTRRVPGLLHHLIESTAGPRSVHLALEGLSSFHRSTSRRMQSLCGRNVDADRAAMRFPVEVHAANAVRASTTRSDTWAPVPALSL
jgi:hypothetical protein